MTTGTARGPRLRCTLCAKQHHQDSGKMRRLEKPTAFTVRGLTAWVAAGDHVCGHHIQMHPQPPMEAGASHG